MEKSKIAIAIVLSSCLFDLAHAQAVVPNAGTLRDKIPASPAVPSGTAPKVQLPAQSTAATKQSSKDEITEGSIEVKQFRFVGDMVGISEAELQNLVNTDTNKIHTLKNLHRISDKVERFLQTDKQFLVVKAWVPLQDVQNGVVEIRILQGTIGQIKMGENLISSSQSGAIAAAQMAALPGSPILTSVLEEAVFRVSDYVGSSVRVVLVPTPTLGQFDIMFEAEPQQKLSGSVVIDNTGNRYTSQWHDTLNLRLNNVSGQYDQLALQSQLLTPNQRSLRLNYQIPLNNGYRFGMALQASRYHLCCDFEPLDARGKTLLASADLKYAWLRSREKNIWFNVEVLQRKLENRQFGITTSDHDVKAVVFGGKMDWTVDKSSNYANLSVSVGNVNLNQGAADLLADRSTAQLQGRFVKTNYGFTHARSLGDAGDFVFNLNGQLSSKNLDSSETFLLGGMGAVRAYPAGEAAGDQTTVAQFEYHKNFSATARGFTFYDHGWVKVHKRPWSSFTGVNDLQLKGLGAGVVWRPSDNFELTLIGAVKLGRNPTANPQNGSDSDGRASRVRIWSFANFRF